MAEAQASHKIDAQLPIDAVKWARNSLFESQAGPIAPKGWLWFQVAPLTPGQTTGSDPSELSEGFFMQRRQKRVVRK